jgi:hypothetical protein
VPPAGRCTAELFERHYLECDECFIELRAGELLASGLERPVVESSTAC